MKKPHPAFFAPVALALPAAGEVNFHEHIAPLVHQHCSACHREGQIGPFPLVTYEEVKRKIRGIVDATGDRLMPPWHADPGVVDFSNDRSLSDSQIKLFEKWFEAGSPEGDPAKASAPPEFPEGWLLGQPDFVAAMPEAFEVPAEGPDIYRNFVIPLDAVTEETWVNAIELRPGEPSVVHHVLYFLDTTGEARKRDAKDPKPGFSSDTGDFRYLGGWDVGTQPHELPYDLALRLPKGADLVIQIHYHPTGKAVKDRTTLGFHRSEKPTARPWSIIPVPAFFGILQGISIPPGEKEHVEKASFTVPADCETFGVSAHAHYLAKRMEMEATFPDGSRRWLLKISDWDFKWQEDYRFREPIKLPAGTVLDVRMTYDNSADNPHNPSRPPKHIVWGPATEDEMGSITLMVMFDTQEQKDQLHKGLSEALASQFVDLLVAEEYGLLAQIGRGGGPREPRPEHVDGLKKARQRLMFLDRNRDGQLDADERRPALPIILADRTLRALRNIGID